MTSSLYILLLAAMIAAAILSMYAVFMTFSLPVAVSIAAVKVLGFLVASLARMGVL